MGAYVVGEDGVLERHSVAPEEELRPLRRLATLAAFDATRRAAMPDDIAHHLRRE